MLQKAVRKQSLQHNEFHCQFNDVPLSKASVNRLEEKMCGVAAIYSNRPLTDFSLVVGNNTWASGKCVYDETRKLYELHFFRNNPVLQFHLIKYNAVCLDKKGNGAWPEIFWLPSHQSSTLPFRQLVEQLDGRPNYIVYAYGCAGMQNSTEYTEWDQTSWS